MPDTPDSPSQRRSRRWLALTVLLLAAMLALPLLGWWFGEGGPGRLNPLAVAPPPAAASAAVADATLGSAAAALSTALAGAPNPRLGQRGPSSAAGSAAPAAASGVETVPVVFDVCGIGLVHVLPPRPPGRSGQAGSTAADEGGVGASASASASARASEDGADLPGPLRDDALQVWWPQLRARLAAGADPRARAVAWLLPADPLAEDRITVPRREPELRQLVAMAAGANDAQLVAWALGACHGGPSPAPAACAGLSARHWVRLAPGNLMPWLWLLGAEPAAQQEALHGMAAAREVVSGLWQLSALVEAAWPEAAPPHLRLMASLRAQALDLGLAAAVRWQPLVAACSGPALNDPNRRQVCEAIARRLVDGAPDLMAHAIGSALGTRLSWPAERLAALKAERDRLVQAPRPPLAAGVALKDLYSCSSVAAMRQWTAALAAHGELGALRRAQAVGDRSTR